MEISACSTGDRESAVMEWTVIECLDWISSSNKSEVSTVAKRTLNLWTVVRAKQTVVLTSSIDVSCSSLYDEYLLKKGVTGVETRNMVLQYC